MRPVLRILTLTVTALLFVPAPAGASEPAIQSGEVWHDVGVASVGEERVARWCGPIGTCEEEPGYTGHPGCVIRTVTPHPAADCWVDLYFLIEGHVSRDGYGLAGKVVTGVFQATDRWCRSGDEFLYECPVPGFRTERFDFTARTGADGRYTAEVGPVRYYGGTDNPMAISLCHGDWHVRATAAGAESWSVGGIPC